MYFCARRAVLAPKSDDATKRAAKRVSDGSKYAEKGSTYRAPSQMRIMPFSRRKRLRAAGDGLMPPVSCFYEMTGGSIWQNYRRC